MEDLNTPQLSSNTGQTGDIISVSSSPALSSNLGYGFERNLNNNSENNAALPLISSHTDIVLDSSCNEQASLSIEGYVGIGISYEINQLVFEKILSDEFFRCSTDNDCVSNVEDYLTGISLYQAESDISQDFNADEIIGANIDEDNNGIVDGSEQSAYELIREAVNNQPVTLKSSGGQTWSDASRSNWNITHAKQTENGFKALLDGTGHSEGQYVVWETDTDGFITTSSGWMSTEQGVNTGLENIFGVDLDNNGLIFGSNSYQFARDNQPVTLKSSGGQTWSDASRSNWNITHAKQTENGFKALLDGTGHSEGQYVVWETDTDGFITTSSGWMSTEQGVNTGLENIFGVDLDNNGLIFGSNSYQFARDNQPVTLKSSGGQTWSDASRSNWNITHAKQTENGFKALLDGTGHSEGQYVVWETDTDGFITTSSGWMSTEQGVNTGLENIFGVDLDNNGLIFGGNSYQFARDNQPVTLKSSGGQTWSDASRSNWNITHAKQTENGFKALLDGTGHSEGQYVVWETDTDGFITTSSGWMTTEQGVNTGLENIFGVDLDNNGLIFGGNSYQFARDNQPVTLKSSGGQTWSDASRSNWNITHAKQTENGFKALLDGTGHSEGQYVVWETDTDGFITTSSGWMSTEQGVNTGLENIFGVDLDNNGLIFGGNSYQFARDNQPVTLKSSGGQTWSDASRSNWNITHAKQTENGFKALLDGTGHSEGQYVVWETDTDGFITTSSGWMTTEQGVNTGLENIFGVDLDKDGVIGEAIKIQGISDESIQNNINSFLSDNLFTHQELKSLLVDVASGGVTATELTDLQTIETNLSGYLSATDDSYQSYIFDAVVNGNTANQWWTGGESSRISLGNLSEGASEDHLNSLVDKWYGGLDRPTNFVQGDSAASASAMTFDYYEMVGDLFVDGVNFDDVRQGQAGTCYVLAAACSYADADSSIITEMFKDNGDGTYGVRFYDNSLSEVWVTVDSYVPSTNGYSTALAGNASWGLSGEKWVSLLEKGYAQANETGAFSRGSDSSKNSYAAVEGGWMDALTHLSGNTTTTVSLNYTGTGGSGTGLNGWTNAWGSQTSWNAFESQAIAAINNNKALWLGSFGNTWGSNGRRDFVAGHAFAITDYNASTGLFTIVNPWGSSSGSSNHTFTARWSELATYGLDPIVSWA